MSEEKGNGKARELVLTKEERLELHNVNLQRQLLDQQVQNEVAKLDAKQNEVAKAVNERLEIDLAKFSVNIETGALKPIKQPEEQAEAE